jgi:hypothetical protein
MIDKLNSASSLETSRCCMAVADAVQRFNREEQILGAAAFFYLLCNETGLHAGTALNTIFNMINSDKIVARDQFNAARMYIQKELVNDAVLP